VLSARQGRSANNPHGRFAKSLRGEIDRSISGAGGGGSSQRGLVLEKIGSRDVIENIMEQLYARVGVWRGEDISASEGYLRATTQKEREVVTSETIVSLDRA